MITTTSALLYNLAVAPLCVFCNLSGAPTTSDLYSQLGDGHAAAALEYYWPKFGCPIVVVLVVVLLNLIVVAQSHI